MERGSVMVEEIAPKLLETEAEPPVTGRRKKPGLYRSLISPDERRMLAKAGLRRDLDSEIEAARVSLIRLLEGGPAKAVDVSRVALNIARLLDLARKLTAANKNPLLDTINDIVNEMMKQDETFGEGEL